MYFNDTVNARIYAYDFDAATGTLSNKREWHRFARGDGYPDGMTTDAAGRLWIAHWGGACVTCHDPSTAAELCRIPLPTSHITDCAFGGKDLTSLYISSATSGLTSPPSGKPNRKPVGSSSFNLTLPACQRRRLAADDKQSFHFENKQVTFSTPLHQRAGGCYALCLSVQCTTVLAESAPPNLKQPPADVGSGDEE